MNTTVIGIDLAKNTFFVCGLNQNGSPVLRKPIARSKLPVFLATQQKTLIAMEACCGANYWAREARSHGHQVKIISPQYVKPYVQSNKNDGNDALGICEAALRKSIPEVPIKETWQQDIQCYHRAKERVLAEKVALTNEIRGFFLEYGIAVAKSDRALQKTIAEYIKADGNDLSGRFKTLLTELHSELIDKMQRLEQLKEHIKSISKASPVCQRLEKLLPAVGPMISTGFVGAVGTASEFKNGRHLAAWLGIVPQHTGTGGLVRILGISKRGDKYLRKILIQGAKNIVRWAQLGKEGIHYDWVRKKLKTMHPNKVAVAFAHKTARMIYTVLRNEVEFSLIKAFA